MSNPDTTWKKKDSPAKPVAPPSSLSIVKMSTVIYGIFALVGLLACRFGHDNLESLFPLGLGIRDYGKFAVAGGLGVGILFVLSKQFEWVFASYRELRFKMIEILGPCSVASALYLALLSSVGEEILFRGAIQPWMGIGMTSLLFGMLHLGPSGNISSWSVWAVLSGALLGYVADQTGNLIAPVITHFGVNAISILSLRRAHKRHEEKLAEQAAAQST